MTTRHKKRGSHSHSSPTSPSNIVAPNMDESEPDPTIPHENDIEPRLYCSVPSPAPHVDHSVDVVVIGAGISGLCAATRLLESTSGNASPLRVAVLEASSRVGGRTLTESVGGVQYDKGGTWIGPTQQHIHTLIKQLGIETMPQYHLGKKVADIRNVVKNYATDIPLFLSPAALWDIVSTGLTLERARDAIDIHDPCQHPNAHYWDSLSVSAWMSLHVSKESSRDLIAIGVRGVWGCEPEELSFLQFLYYMKCAGGIQTLINIKQGHQELVCLGGTQQISEKLAQQLGQPHYEGGSLHLSHTVREMIQYRDSIHVICANGTRFAASYVIAAIPPVIASSIHVTPRLPVAREQLAQRAFMGSIIKAIIVYDRPFWRDHGWSGEVICDCYDVERSPVFNVYDFSRPSPTNQGTWTWALVTFMNGDAARVWSSRSYELRKNTVLQQIERWFGRGTGIALRPVDYGEKDWVIDEYTRGCPVANYAPGLLWTAGHTLRLPIGRIHWAGTETATQHMGFMDGAISAGYRAADQVITKLEQGTHVWIHNTSAPPHRVPHIPQHAPSSHPCSRVVSWVQRLSVLFVAVVVYVYVRWFPQHDRDAFWSQVRIRIGL